MKPDRDTAAHFGLLLILALIWGSSFILIKRGLRDFSPVEVGCLRIVIAGVVLCAISLPYLTKFTRREAAPLFVVGFLGSGLPALLYALAETRLSSALAGVLNSLTPLFTFTIGFVLYRTNIRRLQFAGLIMGFVGALFLVFDTRGGSVASLDIYALLVVAATVCYAISINLIKARLQHIHSRTIAAVSLLMTLPLFAGLLVLTTPFLHRFAEPTVTFGWSLAAVATLAVAGTAFANVLFFRLTQRTSAVFASSVTYLIPIVALLWGLFDNEVIVAAHWFGMGCIVVGVYFVSRK